jgi:hypothetical protein
MSEHDWQRTIRTDGLWCQRCGLAHAQWTSQPCEPEGALARVEAVMLAKVQTAEVDRDAIATLEAQGWHTHDDGVYHMRPVDESADGDISPIGGLTQRESDDFMEAIVTETGDEYAAKSVSVSWKGTPTADVSEQQIAEALMAAPCTCHIQTSADDDPREQDCPHHGDGNPCWLTPTVKGMLDAQAAAHAVEVEALRAEVTKANDLAASNMYAAQQAEAEVVALRAQVRLARGLHEGAMKQAREYRARIDAVRALCKESERHYDDEWVTVRKVRAALDGDA